MTTAVEVPEKVEPIEIACAVCGKVDCGGHNVHDAPADPQPSATPAQDPAPELPRESYRCEDATHLVTVTIERVSPSAFSILGHSGAGDEPAFGMWVDGEPLCPKCSKPMLLWSAEATPAREAIAAAEAELGAAPLPFPPPPFDPDRALRKIEALCQQYSEAIEEHEGLKKETSEAREHREELGTQLRDLITDLRTQRAEAADRTIRPPLPFDVDQAEQDRQHMLAADAAERATVAKASPEPARQLPKRHAAGKKPAQARAKAADAKTSRRAPTPAQVGSELDREASKVRERINRNRRKGGKGRRR